MQTTHQRPSRTGLLGARSIIAITLLTALVLVMSQARPAFAADGVFNFDVATASVQEGDTLTLSITAGGRGGTVNNVNVGVHISNISAEAGDYTSADQCVFFSGAVISQPLFIQTNTDADTQDEQFTVTLTFDSNLVGCVNPGADATVGGQETVLVTIVDTGAGPGANTFKFESASSSGDEGDIVVLDVLRTGDLDGAATVDCVRVSGGTDEPADYDILDGTANFGDNDSTGTCTIQLEADADTDLSETLIIALTDPSSGHTIANPDEHTITILDATAQVVQFSAATYSVDEDGGTASFAVTRSHPAGSDSFICSTEELSGEADEGVDYQATADAINFTGSQGTINCTVPILDDNSFEGSETFRLVLTYVSGDAVLGPIDEAIVTIVDDETSGVTFEFSAANYNVDEGDGTVTVTITRSTSAGAGSVHWATSNGTAVAGTDYTAASGTETFSPGETQETFTVTILQDALVEGNQTINLTLSDPVGGSLGDQDTATITIIDDEGVPTVTNVSPNVGPTAGGTSVVITGTNLTGATAVTFGASNAASFVVNNSTQITAVSPAHAVGTVDIRVTTPGGQSANTTADNFTYQAAVTNTYQLSFRWTLIAWLGKDDISISSALQGVETPDNPSTNNVFAFVTAVATWDAPAQRYLFWFPGGSNVPGANDITTFNFGSAYWVAVNSGVTWTVIQGP
ncbi:MAG TPA: Calx-beta domain-containing protein [Tepidiformaceae bacterium]|nr:Calx-beta domain-containing protein [Tepidiformaceae bacterium]